MMRRSRSRDGVALPPPPSSSSEESAAAAASGNGGVTAAEGGKILSLRLGDLVCVTQETKGERHEKEEGEGETGARMRQARVWHRVLGWWLDHCIAHVFINIAIQGDQDIKRKYAVGKQIQVRP